MRNDSKSSSTKKNNSNQSSNRADYNKPNKKREEFEDVKKFEDFNAFVKETGWKKTGNQSSKSTSNRSGVKAGGYSSNRSGVKSGNNTSIKSGNRTGEFKSNYAGNRAGNNVTGSEGDRTGNRFGNKTTGTEADRTGNRTGNRFGNKQVGTEADRTGNRTGNRFGNKQVGTGADRTGNRTENRPDSRTGYRSENRTDSRSEGRTTGYRSDSRSENRTDNRSEGRTTGYRSENRTDNRSEGKTGFRSENRTDNRSDGRTGFRSEHRADNRTDGKTGFRSENRTDTRADSKTGYRAGKGKGSDQTHNSSKQRSGSTYNKGQIANENRSTDSTTVVKGRGKRDWQEATTPSKKKGDCDYQRECGGCNILFDSYEKHLAGKQKEVETLLKKYCKVEPILGMKTPDHYRHKVQVVFDHDRKGNPISGVYEEGTHNVIAVEKCLIHNEKADAIIASIRGMLKGFKILTYDEDTGYGLIRHVMIRTGYHSGEIMVVLVLASPIMPSKNNFVKALRAEHPEITTIVVNVNDKQTSMVLGDKEQVIYGKGYIEDSLCGKTFHISPKSFYQVNPVQTEILYNKAIELADLSGEETVIDAYCGIGTIGIIASDHAKQVIGVELNKDAVRDAVVNAKLNQATNIEFFKNDAGVFMSQMADKKETADVIFMDPPRTGSTPQFMDAIVVLKPKKIVYVSCNPISLERDLEYLTKKGYKAQVAIPVDMFPWTGHVETVVLMSRKDK
jgi:23S rRNA (uracil1939-C5)-methyltransferase